MNLDRVEKFSVPGFRFPHFQFQSLQVPLPIKIAKSFQFTKAVKPTKDEDEVEERFGKTVLSESGG